MLRPTGYQSLPEYLTRLLLGVAQVHKALDEGEARGVAILLALACQPLPVLGRSYNDLDGLTFPLPNLPGNGLNDHRLKLLRAVRVEKERVFVALEDHHLQDLAAKIRRQIFLCPFLTFLLRVLPGHGRSIERLNAVARSIWHPSNIVQMNEFHGFSPPLEVDRHIPLFIDLNLGDIIDASRAVKADQKRIRKAKRLCFFLHCLSCRFGGLAVPCVV